MRRGCTFLALARVPLEGVFRLPAGSQGSKKSLFGVRQVPQIGFFGTPGRFPMGFSRGRVGGVPGREAGVPENAIFDP